MNPTKRLTGACSECGGPIQFPAELVGTTTTCPHCRKQTELMLAAPPTESALPRKLIIFTVVAVVILIVGLIVLVAGLKHFENLAARQRARSVATAGGTDSAVPTGLEVSVFSLEKGSSGNELYVVGTVANTSQGRHLRIRVVFDLFDAEGHKVGVATGYRPVLEPGAKWEIKVSVASDTKAAFTKLASIKEGP
ncbi:MAG: FxLYD domain-containing protein [Verrucomicrobia bacterium]|nr:FxLYD domain-containing protein [Verrucomicrobiota bacterium]